MRYCRGCGNPMGNERFCIKCGMDNSGTAPMPDGNAGISGAGQPIKLDLPSIIHWVMIILFAVEAVIGLVACCSDAEIIMPQTMLQNGGIIVAVVYFVLGMWSVIPAVWFILSGSKTRSTTIMTVSAILAAITIVLAIAGAIVKNMSGIAGVCGAAFEPYTGKMVIFIILTVVIAAAGVFHRYTEMKGAL